VRKRELDLALQGSTDFNRMDLVRIGRKTTCLVIAGLPSPEKQLLTTCGRLSGVSIGFCHTVATELKSVLAILMALKLEPP
jgi:hypothetical protein